MSTAAFPSTYPTPQPGPHGGGPGLSLTTVPNRDLPSPAIRRLADIEQGHALKILRLAVEYLVDSRMFFVDEPAIKADRDATNILMRLSREVFSECTETVPTRARLRQWMAHQLNGPAN